MVYEIFVVEDDENIQDLIRITLESSGYSPTLFSNSTDFFKALQFKIPTLVILDVMLPGENGYDIIKRLKKTEDYKQLPVIFLTAKSAEMDKVHGLNLGADDFIVKPFGVLEFLARVSAVIRRCAVEPTQEDNITFKDLVISTNEKSIYKNGEKIPLTFKEYEMFLFMYKNKGVVLSREKLLEQVWGFDFDGETRTVDAHVRSLRLKLTDSSAEPLYIQTFRGHGYMMIR